MSSEKNVKIVKNFLAALGRRDKQEMLALSAEDIEWIIPGEDWPLAGTHRRHAGLENLLEKANEAVETSYPKPPSSYPRETGFWSSASLPEKSRLRIRRSKTTGSSTLLFEMAN
jgi:ketosteroid isomerase-like protein